MKPIAIFTTTASADEARRIARAVLERHLAACAQITEIESFYHWRGVIQNETEYRILFKTTDAQYAQVEAAILELHSYELPGIYSLPFDRSFGPYAKWIAEESRAS